MHFEAAGGRGTVEQRGIERQTKLDGLRKWKFNPTMQLFPLLFQLALFLFTAALTTYLWTVHRSVAGVVFGLSILGVAVYLFLTISAILFHDSPFKTPLTTFLTSVKAPDRTTMRRLCDVGRHLFPLFMNCTIPIANPDEEAREHHPTISKHYDFPESSAAVPSILWMLETTTNPDLITVAARMAVPMQWPLNPDLDGPLHRLAQTFLSCFITSGGWLRIREGAIHRAIHCGQAYGLLSQVQNKPPITVDFMKLELRFPPREVDESLQMAELRSVWSAFEGSVDFRGIQSSSMMDWLFRVLPHTVHNRNYKLKLEQIASSLDYLRPGDIDVLGPSTFNNYLFFINSLFIPPDTRDQIWLNKRYIFSRLQGI